MKAIILAAGSGGRLQPYTLTTPKCLLDVGGKEILGRQLIALKSCGIKDVIIVVGYRKEMIEKYLSIFENIVNIEYVYNPDYAITNNNYSLKLALEEYKGSFVLLNGDTVFHDKVLEKTIKSPYPNAMAVVMKKCESEDMKIILHGNKIIALNKNTLQGVGEFMGIAKFTEKLPTIHSFIKGQGDNEWFEKGIEKMLVVNPTYCVDVSNYPCIEIDFEQDLMEANEMFPWGQPVWEQGIRHGTPMDKDKAFLLLCDTVDTLEKHQIKYWINWGTLLGFIRDGDFIEWDTDIDVTCHWEDRSKVIDLIEKELLEKKCFIPEPDECYPEDRWYIRDKEKIELNFVEKDPNRNYYVYSPGRCKLGCPATYLAKLDTFEYRGRKFFIPANAEEYLRLSYGDNWRIPQKGIKPVSL